MMSHRSSSDPDRPSRGLAALHWYTARAKVILPAALAIAGMLGFLAYTPGSRLTALEAQQRDHTKGQRELRAYVDSEVAALHASASVDRQLLVGLARFQCLAASAREIGLSGLPCDALLGRRPYNTTPEAP